MKPIDPNDPLTKRLRMLVYRYLRDQQYMVALSLASTEHENVVKIACPDDRSFMTEAAWIEQLHAKSDRKIGVMPNPMFGGAMRFSPYCPEMLDQQVGFKNSPNSAHCQITVEKIRYGIRFRNVRLAKAGGHGLYCGWAAELGLGFFQHTRLTIDGRNVLKRRAHVERWLQAHPDPNMHGKEFQVFPAHHMDCCTDGATKPRTYALDHTHHLVRKYPMELVMSDLNDQRFLEFEAPHLLKDAESEPVTA